MILAAGWLISFLLPIILFLAYILILLVNMSIFIVVKIKEKNRGVFCLIILRR